MSTLLHSTWSRRISAALVKPGFNLHVRQRLSTLGTYGSLETPRPSYGGYVLPSVAAAFALCAFGQSRYGNQKDFYDYRFTTSKDPNDLAGFYGSEQFMDIFCVLPFMGTLMMRGGTFDEEGTVHTTGFPGDMQVSMVFSDESDEEGNIKWFNKRERFRDVCFGYTCWDMVTNFGFERLPDGRTMVYHHGEYFKSRFPPFSLLVRIVFGVHARWVAWAAEHHINHYAFQNDSEFDEQLEEESREDMPLFLLKNYAWTDLTAAMFGQKIEKPSFLVKKSAEAAIRAETEDEDIEDEVEDESYLEDNLPTQRPAIKRRITADIHFDRRNSRIAHQEEGDDVSVKPAKIDIKVAIQRTTTLNRDLSNDEEGNEEAEPLQRHVSLKRENLGGHPAWETLRSTNNPEAYRAASIVAKSRYTQRRASLRSEGRQLTDEGAIVQQDVQDSVESLET